MNANSRVVVSARRITGALACAAVLSVAHGVRADVPGANSSSSLARADSTAELSAPRVEPPARSEWNSADHTSYLRRHSVMIGQWLEWDPGYLVTRSGPPGFASAVSRWGMGRGRALLLLDGVEMNDPHTGVAWLADLPVAALGTIRVGETGFGEYDAFVPAEGVVAIDERDAPTGKPETFVEMSKGTSALRQRRVAYSSAEGTAGIDMQYDELLEDGYNFDRTGRVGLGVPGYGLARSRHTSARFRGTIPEVGRYAFGFRRWVADTQGDLISSLHTTHRTGHLATVRASVGRVHLLAFDRSLEYAGSDSARASGTRGARATIHAMDARGTELFVQTALDEIAGEQNWGVAGTRHLVRRAKISVGGQGTWRGARLHAFGAWSGYSGFAHGVGAGVDLSRTLGAYEVSARVRRSIRLPTLSELFAPVHSTGAVQITGNENLNVENAIEVSAHMAMVRAGFSNELVASALRAGASIAPTGKAGGGVRQMANNPSRHISVVEERTRFERHMRGLLLRFGGGVTWASAAQEGFFAGVPRWRGSLRARIGGEMFQRTSAMYLDVEYVHTGPRTDVDGRNLDSWNVVNVFLSARLIDAHMYVGFVNALGKTYSTRGDYRMLPRTMMYGLAWTLYN